MRVPDKWNPRLWLRAWLLAPSKTEAAQAARIRAGVEAACAAWESNHSAISSRVRLTDESSR